MTRFTRVLQRTERRLEVPEPARTRILLEIAADLEDGYQHFRRQGCDEAEAVRRAEEAFATSDDALDLLSRIHRPGLGSSTDRVLQQVGTVWSKILIVAVLVFEILLAVRVFSSRSFFVHPSPFLWPLAGIALATFLFTLWKLAQIFSRSRIEVRRLRTGLGVPLAFAGASLAVAGLGFLFHLQRFFRLNADHAPEALVRNFAGWMISISSLMTVGLLTAILAALLWFVLSGLVVRSEAREMRQLLESSV